MATDRGAVPEATDHGTVVPDGDRPTMASSWMATDRGAVVPDGDRPWRHPGWRPTVASNSPVLCAVCNLLIGLRMGTVVCA
jgi:hypothetical protein